jgi:hypothetical protein
MPLLSLLPLRSSHFHSRLLVPQVSLSLHSGDVQCCPC